MKLPKLNLLIITILLSCFSLAQEVKLPDYSQTPRSGIPKQYQWSTEDIYSNVEAWKKDIKEAKELLTLAESKSKGWTSSPKKMLEMFELTDKIGMKAEKLYAYASVNSDADLGNSEYQILKGEARSFYVNMGSSISFMSNDILSLSEETIKKYLKQEPGLKPYKFYLEETLRSKKHILPKEQEQILSLTGLFSAAPNSAFELLDDVDLPAPEVTLSNGTKMTLNYPNYVLLRANKNREDRSMAMKSFWENHAKFANTFAALLDGEMKNHLFNAKVRHFKDCLEARLFTDNIDTSVYYNLIKEVNANLSPLHHYLKLKKELLGYDTLKYDDIYVSPVKSVDKIYSPEEAQKIIVNTLEFMGPEYIAGIKTAFKDRWIDLYPNLGKQSGAYSSGVYGVHPFIKLNYNGEYDAVDAMIHELGHSIHSYLSYKYQPYITGSYTTFLAEIASTFNENMLMENMLKNEKDDMFKLYILDNYLDQARGTIYRQALFAEFELAMHKRVEEGNTLTADWLNKTYLDLTRKYYGHKDGVMQVGDYIQNEWSNIPHFFMNYYVFQYSTGMIASMALSQKVLNGNKEDLDKYLTMLKSGGSDYSIELLKKAGVDMTKPEPYEQAFKRFDNLVNEMEKLVTKLKQEGKI